MIWVAGAIGCVFGVTVTCLVTWSWYKSLEAKWAGLVKNYREMLDAARAREDKLSSRGCDDEIYQHGKTVAVILDIETKVANAWCLGVAQSSGQKVDWYYVGGRCVVRAMGDLAKVDAAAFYSTGGPELRGLGGAHSFAGYYPHGPSHWSQEKALDP